MSVPTRANADLIEADAAALARQSRRGRSDVARLLPGLRPRQQRRACPSAAEARGRAPSAIIDSLKQSHVHDLIAAYRAHRPPRRPTSTRSSGPPPPTPKLALAQFSLSEADLDTSFDIGTYLGGGQMKLRDDHRRAAGDLLRPRRRRVHAHPGPGLPPLAPGADRVDAPAAEVHPAAEGPDPAPGAQGRAFREIPAHQVRRPEALFARGRRDDHRRARRGDRPLPRARASRRSCMGMAHRGRLNVLCSVMRKSFDQLFEQFSENYMPDSVAGDGDVKYHLGYESVLTTTSGQQGRGAPRRQSLPPGDRRSGRRGQGPRPPAHPRGHPRSAAGCCRC